MENIFHKNCWKLFSGGKSFPLSRWILSKSGTYIPNSSCTNTEHWLNILKWNILSQLLDKISFKVKGSKCPFKFFGKKSWYPYFFLQVGSVLQPTLAWPLFQMVLTITQLWKGRSAKKMHTHIFLDIYFFAFTLEALGFHILLKRAKRASRGPSWPSDDA